MVSSHALSVCKNYCSFFIYFCPRCERSAVTLCACFRGGPGGRAGSRAGGGSHSASAVDRVRVAMEEQVSKPFISSASGKKAFKHANEADKAGGSTVL